MSESVIVVGAGLAGLSCAYELSKNSDYKVTLLEASDYLGGRVRSLSVQGHQVDFGGFIIYPWYEQYHRLLSELKIQDQIEPIALKDIFYDLDGDQIYRTQRDLDFPASDTMKLYPRLAFPVLAQDDMAEPDLERFAGRTISEHFRHILGVKHETIYERFTDIVCQGYCYGPVDQYKMAFVAPIIRFQRLYGDISTAFYFRYGNSIFANAMGDAIIKNGGSIKLSSKVTKITGNQVSTKDAEYTADSIVFALPANDPIYEQVLPNAKPDCDYTHFYSVTAKADKVPSVNGSNDWGAVFYKPQRHVPFQILSSINLPSLYDNSLAGCINLNVIVHDELLEDTDRTKEEMYQEILPQLKVLFPDVVWEAVIELNHWSVTMPVANEAFVEQVRQAQGDNRYFFAGDYLGSPSMETALTTGIRAAEMVQGIVAPTRVQKVQENAQKMQKKLVARMNGLTRQQD